MSLNVLGDRTKTRQGYIFYFTLPYIFLQSVIYHRNSGENYRNDEPSKLATKRSSKYCRHVSQHLCELVSETMDTNKG